MQCSSTSSTCNSVIEGSAGGGKGAMCGETDGIWLCGHHRTREQGKEKVNIAPGYRSINSYTTCYGNGPT